MILELKKRRVLGEDSDNPFVRLTYLIPGEYVIYLTYIDGKATLETEGLKGTPQPEIICLDGHCRMEVKASYKFEESEKIAENVKEAEKIARILTANIKTLLSNKEAIIELKEPPPDS